MPFLQINSSIDSLEQKMVFYDFIFYKKFHFVLNSVPYPNTRNSNKKWTMNELLYGVITEPYSIQNVFIVRFLLISSS